MSAPELLPLVAVLLACNGAIAVDAGAEGGCPEDRPNVCGTVCCVQLGQCNQNGGDQCCTEGVPCGARCCTKAEPFCGNNQSCCDAGNYCNGACCIGGTACNYDDAGVMRCLP